MKYIICCLVGFFISFATKAQGKEKFVVLYQFDQPAYKEPPDSNKIQKLANGVFIIPDTLRSDAVTFQFLISGDSNQSIQITKDSVRFEKGKGWEYKLDGKWTILETKSNFSIKKTEDTKYIMGYKATKFLWKWYKNEADIWASEQIPSTFLRIGMEDFGYGILEIQGTYPHEWSIRAIKIEKF